MFKEIDICGILITPIFGCAIVAAAAFIPLSLIFDRWEIHRWVANRPVFDASIFVLLLGLIHFIFRVV